ncbi:MAG: hypothetical protein KJ914_15355 [Gammaproteobacteria bacterium]|nr:hypothetical protein [Gammaproteobacteria bacterium]MBU1723324.1 hypothetical protein [Gammaproteobacteria bacterium]MBU2006619.1 hypothetical protein [Gammaproteobacteria bacterium]
MADQNKKQLALIHKLVKENDNAVDFLLDLQGYPQIQNNRDALHLALQSWQKAHPQSCQFRTAA